jgi:hypothetical protein
MPPDKTLRPPPLPGMATDRFGALWEIIVMPETGERV